MVSNPVPLGDFGFGVGANQRKYTDLVADCLVVAALKLSSAGSIARKHRMGRDRSWRWPICTQGLLAILAPGGI